MSETIERISSWQEAEWAPLRTVVMALANPLPKNVIELFASEHAELDEALLFQMQNNEWAPYDVDKVHQQQRAFIAGMEKEGVEVLLAEQVGDAPTQHFARDIGFVIDDLFIWSRMHREARAREQAAIGSIVDRLPRVARLDAGRIEGGDVLAGGPGEVIVGFGEETDAEGVDALRRTLAANEIDREIVTVAFNERGVIHTDAKFNIIGPELAIFDPSALTPESRHVVEQRFDLIEATPEESMKVEINTLVIGDRKLAMTTRAKRLAEEVAKRGIEPVLFDYDEVNKFPGSLRCTTLPLVRDRATP